MECTRYADGTRKVTSWVGVARGLHRLAPCHNVSAARTVAWSTGCCGQLNTRRAQGKSKVTFDGMMASVRRLHKVISGRCLLRGSAASRPSVRPSFRVCVRACVRPSVRPSALPFVRPSGLSVPSMRPSVRQHSRCVQGVSEDHLKSLARLKVGRTCTHTWHIHTCMCAHSSCGRLKLANLLKPALGTSCRDDVSLPVQPFLSGPGVCPHAPRTHSSANLPNYLQRRWKDTVH